MNTLLGLNEQFTSPSKTVILIMSERFTAVYVEEMKDYKVVRAGQIPAFQNHTDLSPR